MARMRIRNLTSFFVLLLAGTTLARAQVALGQTSSRPTPPARSAGAPATKSQVAAEPRPAAPDPARLAQLEKVLKGWEQRSARIKTLYTSFTRYDDLVVANDKRSFIGQAELKSPDLAYLNLQELDVKNKNQPEPMTERIVCTGKEVWQYDNESKQIFIFPLAKDERKRAIEEGPLPFLFNFKVDEAKQRYRFQLLDSAPPAEGKPGVYILEITPLLPIDIQEFKTAWILLNRERFLPEAIKLWSPNGRDTRLYKFPNIQANVAIDPARFNPQPMAGFKVVRNPGAATPPRGAQPAVGAAPAPRNGQAAPKIGRRPN
jgi:TIGR03009 family protein